MIGHTLLTFSKGDIGNHIPVFLADYAVKIFHDVALQRLHIQQSFVLQDHSILKHFHTAALLKQNSAKLPKQEKPLHVLPAELTELETLCRETFGMRATLTGTAKKGKIVLQYYSQDELERLNELLQQMNGN